MVDLLQELVDLELWTPLLRLKALEAVEVPFGGAPFPMEDDIRLVSSVEIS